MDAGWRKIPGALVLCLCCQALGGGAQAKAPQHEAVQLAKRSTHSLGDDVEIEMFPRVLPGPVVSAAVADRINQSLDRFNAEALRDARECSRAERARGPEHLVDFHRSIEVTMQGPRYLSFVAEDAFMCGGAHPADNELALVYDLTTGLPLDWTRLLPKGATGKVYRRDGRLPIGMVEWPLVMRKVRTHTADGGNSAEECASAYDNLNTDFNVWLDATEHALVFSPQLGSHFDTAMCSQR